MFKKADSIYCLLFLLSSSPGIVNAATVDAVNEVRSIRQDEKCTGIIKDATGEAVIGASVVVKGTTNGTITGLDGDFILDKVKKRRYHLRFICRLRYPGNQMERTTDYHYIG